MDIRYESTEELINLYAYAQKEWDDEYSKEKLKSLVKKELQRRFKAVLGFLNDEQAAQNPAGVYNYLLGK